MHQLDRLKKANWTGNNFSICDHSSGHELYEQCAILQERFDKIERDQKLNELTSAWSARDRKAFHSFLAEAENFFHVQASNGVNLEGTFEIQEEIFLKNGLLSALEQFERGELPGIQPRSSIARKQRRTPLICARKPAPLRNGGPSRARASGRARRNGIAIVTPGSSSASKSTPV